MNAKETQAHTSHTHCHTHQPHTLPHTCLWCFQRSLISCRIIQSSTAFIMMYAIKSNAAVVMSDCLSVCCDVSKCIKSAVKTCLFYCRCSLWNNLSDSSDLFKWSFFLFGVFILQNIWRKKITKTLFFRPLRHQLFNNTHVCLHTILWLTAKPAVAAASCRTSSWNSNSMINLPEY